MTTYDLHAHCAVPATRGLVADEPGFVEDSRRQADMFGPDSMAYNAKVAPGWFPKLVDVDLRFAAMDAMGVDVQVVSPSPGEYHYWAPADLASRIVDTVNEGVAALCAPRPDRLMGLGSVALQHPGARGRAARARRA